MRRLLVPAIALVAVTAFAQADPRPAGITTEGVWIQDQKHHKDLIAGDVYDGNIYHQDPNGRQNALWRLTPVGDGSFILTDLKHRKALVGRAAARVGSRLNRQSDVPPIFPERSAEHDAVEWDRRPRARCAQWAMLHSRAFQSFRPFAT